MKFKPSSLVFYQLSDVASRPLVCINALRNNISLRNKKIFLPFSLFLWYLKGNKLKRLDSVEI